MAKDIFNTRDFNKREKLTKEEVREKLIDIYENTGMGIGYIIEEAWDQSKVSNK